MHTVRIRRLHAQYRLPGRAARARARLDAILASTLGEAMEAALERLPLDPREELCIRRLSVPVQLRLAASDLVLAKNWGEAVVSAIDEARLNSQSVGAAGVVQGSSGAVLEVVSYPSRQVAWLEVSQRNAGGDRRRAWAWRQLDLWRAGDQVSESEAVREWVRTLVREPRFIVPTWRWLAARGGLDWYARRLEGSHWLSLAAAACEVNGVPLSWRDIGRSPGVASPLAAMEDRSRYRRASRGFEEDSAPSGGLERPVSERENGDADQADRAMRALAERVIRGSSLARVLVATVRESTVLRAMVTLAILDGDPGWSGRSRSAWLQALDALERAWTETPPSTAPPADEHSPEKRQQRPSPKRSAEAPVPPRDPVDGEARVTAVEADSFAERDFEGRLRAATTLGGLLFVLNLLPVVGWPSRADRDFPGRSFRWALHRLGRRLLARAEAAFQDDDSALLAFAGLPPEGPVPESEGEISEAEAEALEALVEAIQQALAERLSSMEPVPENVLGWLCRRSAEIVADLGWIEVRFPLDSVSTDLRRAGLDLDPDYVPWLGVVVRFAYE